VDAGKVVIFSKLYAECYDQIHSSKSYEGESKRMLDFLKTELGKTDIMKIMDFGCGTGAHLNSLAGERLELYGYDRNEYMLEVARRKYPNLSMSSDYSQIPGDLDLVYSLFDVVNYQITDAEVGIFFRSLASKLSSGAMLLIDGWHYPGVKLDPPNVRERDIAFESAIITRRVQPSSQDEYRTTILDITLEDKARSEILTHESHTMRAFERDELADAASACGFRDITFRDASEWSSELHDESWRFVMFAEKG
jgi:SAM-dependent methyltransferase